VKNEEKFQPEEQLDEAGLVPTQGEEMNKNITVRGDGWEEAE
jgi:hypothetical protein